MMPAGCNVALQTKGRLALQQRQDHGFGGTLAGLREGGGGGGKRTYEISS